MRAQVAASTVTLATLLVFGAPLGMLLGWAVGTAAYYGGTWIKREVLDKTVPADSLGEWTTIDAKCEGIFRAADDCKPSWDDPRHPLYIPPPAPEQSDLIGVQTTDDNMIRVWRENGNECRIDPRRVASIRLTGHFDWIEVVLSDGRYETFVSSEPSEANGWWRCLRRGVCGRWNPPGAADCADCRAAPLSGVLTLAERISMHDAVRAQWAAKQNAKGAAKPVLLENGPWKGWKADGMRSDGGLADLTNQATPGTIIVQDNGGL